jgi:hypothetical protein
MTLLRIDGLTFTFPAGWAAEQYDLWSFYRNQFGKPDGIKAIDILALSPSGAAWLVEVKDYRVYPRTKPSDIGDEVTRKVLDTLAALLPASCNANEDGEKQMATKVLRATTLRVVLHLEQPAKTSRLRPRAINALDVAQKLKRLLKAIDAHPFVAEKGRMGALTWSVA